MLTTQAELIHTEQVAGNHWLLRLGCPPVAEQAQPGQFVTVRVANIEAPLLRRPFSIMNVNQAEGSFELLVRVVGAGTKILAEAAVGTYFDLVGPTGQPFPHSDNPEEVLLVAGGAGVAPLIFLAEVLQASTMPCYVRGLFGADTEDNLVCWQEFSTRCDEFTVATEDGSAGEVGMVTDLLADQLGRGDADCVYACGPVAMLAEVAGQCEAHQLPCWVSIEQRMACGVGACLGCVVPVRGQGYSRYLRVCREGPVFAATQIDWEAIRADCE